MSRCPEVRDVVVVEADDGKTGCARKRRRVPERVPDSRGEREGNRRDAEGSRPPDPGLKGGAALLEVIE